MESIPQQPLNFFEELVMSNKLTFLKDRFISDFVETGKYMKLESIDKESGTIQYWDVFYDEIKDDSIEALTSISFEKEFNRKIKDEFKRAKIKLDLFILEITTNGKNPSEYILLNQNILQQLKIKAESYYPETPVVIKAVAALLNHLISKYNAVCAVHLNLSRDRSTAIENLDEYSPDSFLWDSFDNEQRLENLKSLYNKLTENPKVIDCTEDEFIRAFTQRSVVNGIKWCIKGRNRYISKPSLLYFIDHLNKEGYINEIPSDELNKKIEYVFRDFNGATLKNIRQSKYASSLFPAGKDRLDDIFSDL